MIFLKKFNESDNITIYDEKVKKSFPNELEIYTSDGNYKLIKSDITRENDIIRAFYYQNTANDGDVTKDGEPDTLSLDIHFVKNENGFKTLVDIIYGDQMKSEFSIESPNKITIAHYNGIGSVADKYSQFGFEDKSINDLVKFFNNFNFGYKLSSDDFKFIDKYPDTYQQNEDIKLTPLHNNKKMLIINNSGTIDNMYLNNIVNYLRMRGIDHIIVSKIDEIPDFKNIIGAISTGSDFRFIIGFR